MPVDVPKAKWSYQKVIVLWGVSACLCMTVKGQGPSNKEAQEKANELANQAFVQRFKEEPTSGYVGPVSTGKLFCLDVVRVAPSVCEVVTEYRNPTFSSIPKDRTPADVENKVWSWSVIANFQIFRVRHIADGTWGPWTEWHDRDKSQDATYEVMKLRYANDSWTWEPGDDVVRFIQGWNIDSTQKLASADVLNPKTHSKAATALDSVRCHDSLNHLVPLQEVSREDAFRWCGITPQRWDELRNSDRKGLPPKQTPPQLPGAPGSAPGIPPAANSAELAPGKDALTTRSFPDPRGRGPDCGIPQGTQVFIQSVDKQTGKLQVFVVPNGKRDSKKCTNFLTADRTELRTIEGHPTPK